MAGLAVTVAAAVTVRSDAAVPRATLAHMSFPVHYSATLVEQSTNSVTGSNPTHCGAVQQSGSLTSKVKPGQTTLNFSHDPGSRDIEIMWGNGHGPGGNPAGVISYAEQAKGTLDNTPCGGTVEPTYDTSHCGSATRKGGVYFIPTDNKDVELPENVVSPVNEHKVKLKLRWDLTPGLLDGCNPGPAVFSTASGLDIFALAAQPVDYWKLYLCRVNGHTGCGLTVHGSKTFPVHNVQDPGTGSDVSTTDGTAKLTWTVTIGSHG